MVVWSPVHLFCILRRFGTSNRPSWGRTPTNFLYTLYKVYPVQFFTSKICSIVCTFLHKIFIRSVDVCPYNLHVYLHACVPECIQKTQSCMWRYSVLNSVKGVWWRLMSDFSGKIWDTWAQRLYFCTYKYLLALFVVVGVYFEICIRYRQSV